jgi:hypothetical protein
VGAWFGCPFNPSKNIADLHRPPFAAPYRRDTPASMNCDTVVGDLKAIAVIKIQNRPTWLYCNPCPGMRCIGLAAHCYLDAVH